MTELLLGKNNIGDDGASAIAEGLKHNGALKELYLSSNQIGDEGAKALAASGFGKFFFLIPGNFLEYVLSGKGP